MTRALDLSFSALENLDKPDFLNPSSGPLLNCTTRPQTSDPAGPKPLTLALAPIENP